jgi:Fe-S-cluster-containing dehydrogenase component/CRP-like cAMP-binding protein
VSRDVGTEGAWPRAVWESPWLCDLDGGARAQIEAAGSLRRLERGASVFSAGDAADAFFVVAEGLVDLRAIRRGEAEASLLRRAAGGDAVGEEAIVRPGATRASDATCATAVVVVGVPVAVFRRAAERTGAAHGVERSLRTAAARDVLRASALGRTLSDRDVSALVDAAEHRALARGEVLFAQGDPMSFAYVVADGILRVHTEDDGRVHVRAYVTRGDLLTGGAIEAGGQHEVTASASGPAWVLAIPRDAVLRAAKRAPGALARAGRLASSPPLPEATRHVLGDLWRFAVAGSMLVIDDESCVRCGHCAWSCAQAHDDGVSRLVRRGDKVIVRGDVPGESRALVVPGSCQHCKHPACMLECPTGAIGRDPRGEVFVREELCVGCGGCVRACPWGSVQMAPRTADAKKRLPLASADVAVKCDVCRDEPAGPACVSACPVDAIRRVDPTTAIAEVKAAVGARTRTVVPPAATSERSPAWPWVVGAALVAAAAARTPVASRGAHVVSGVVAAALIAALVAYSAAKRVRWGRGRAERSRVRPHLVAHLTLGVLAAGAVAAHAGTHFPANVAGGLYLAFVFATVTGAAMALAYRLVPRALSRVERRSMLPEDLADRARELDERVFGVVTGRSDAMKAVYARILAPYARAPLGGLALVYRRSTLREEEARLRRHIAAAIGDRASHLDGLDDLVRLVVERRALRAQVLLQRLLRAWIPAHVVGVAVAVVLLIAHVAFVARWW